MNVLHIACLVIAVCSFAAAAANRPGPINWIGFGLLAWLVSTLI